MGVVTVWLVWHHLDPPGSGWAGEVWSWPRAVDAIRGHPSPGGSARLCPVEVIYREAVAEARREACLWRAAPPRQRRYTQPGCGLGALLQRLTIDAATEAELHMHVDAARIGFATEGLTLVLTFRPGGAGRARAARHPARRRPATPDRVPDQRRRAAARPGHRRPSRAGGRLPSQQHQPGPRAGPAATRHLPHPEPARPLLRAALIDHQAHGLPAYALFTGVRGGGLLLPQAMGNLIGRAAVLVSLPERFPRRNRSPPHSSTVALPGSTAVDLPRDYDLTCHFFGLEAPARQRPRHSTDHCTFRRAPQLHSRSTPTRPTPMSRAI